jgi:hypothetical protein
MDDEEEDETTGPTTVAVTPSAPIPIPGTATPNHLV